MKILHHPSRAFSFLQKKAAAWTTFGIGMLLIFGSLLSLYRMWPTLGEGTYAFENQEPQSFESPLYFESQSGLMHVEVEMYVPSNYPDWFAFTPDDCLEALRINDQDVSFESPLCLDEHGVPLNIGEYLNGGEVNRITMDIRDHGGFGGFSIAPWFGDPSIVLRLILMSIGLLFAVTAVLFLAKASRTTFVLYAILFVGLVVRLMLSQTDGYGFDVSTNQGWAKSATVLGFAESYKEQIEGTMIPNYAPFSMILFGVTGHAYEFFYSDGFDRFDPLFRTAIKFPAILADIITAALLFVLLKRKRHEQIGLLSAFAYAVHPAVIYNSAVWGQIDSVYTVFIVASLVAALSNRPYLFGILGMLAVLTKLQAIILFPAAFLLAISNRKTLTWTILGMLTSLIFVLTPFAIGGSINEIVNVYTGSVGYYPQLSFGAYNFWQALFGGDVGRSDHDLIFNLISYRGFGLILFVLTPIILLAKHWRQHLKISAQFPQNIVPVLVTAMTAYAFFLFNTEMHERYLFPFIALGIPFLFISRTAMWAYITASALFLLNLMGQLPFMFIDKGIYNAFPNFRDAIGAWHVVMFVILFATTWKIHAPKGTGWTRLKLWLKR